MFTSILLRLLSEINVRNIIFKKIKTVQNIIQLNYEYILIIPIRYIHATYSKYKVVRVNKKARAHIQLNICSRFSVKCGKSDLKPIIERLRDLLIM